MSHDSMDERLDEEVRFHVDMQTERNVRLGMSPEEARRQALITFGGCERWKSEAREQFRARPWQTDTLPQDARYAFRSLGRRPGFVAAVVATLALGIGANTAIFSLVDAVLLHPLPVARPHELVAVYQALDERTPHAAVPYPLFTTFRDRVRSVADLAGYVDLQIGVRIGGRSEQFAITGVSGNYFDVLGLSPQVGRLIGDADDEGVAANPVVVLSDAVWSRFFNRDPAAAGATIHAGERAYTVIGVAPRDFRGTELARSPELWFPISMVTSLGEGGLFSGRMTKEVYTTTAFGWVKLVGRRLSDASDAAFRHELVAIARDYWRGQGADGAARAALPKLVSVYPVVHAASLAGRDDLTRFVTILLAVVTLTLLIACVNVANLMLMRSTERVRELAVRVALGAGRLRLTRQLFVESLLLATLGAAAGLGVGVVTMRLLSAFTLPGEIALATVGLSLDGRVLAFTAGVAAVAAIVFGLIPAIRASGLAPATVLKVHGAASGRATKGVLVTVQVAMSLLLLVSATLFVRSLQAGLRADLGFDPRPLAAVTVNVRVQGYDRDRESQFYAEAEERARQIPGVVAAAVAASVPLSYVGQLPFTPPVETGATPARVTAGFNPVSPPYFEVLGTPVIEGRGFTTTDDRAAPPVAVVNESAAQLLAPDGRILGRSIRLLGAIQMTVVGVVRDTRIESVRDEGFPMIFAPIAQRPASTDGASIVVRSSSPAAALPALQRVLSAIDPNVPVRHARLVADQLDAVLMPQRFGATLLGVFALVALCVSAVGIYGVVAYGVSRRLGELGIRVALGAQRRDIVRVVALRSGVAVMAGIALGVAAALAATRGIERFLFGVTRLDPIAFAFAVVLLGAAAIVACVGPVRRAMSIDPMSAIRAD